MAKHLYRLGKLTELQTQLPRDMVARDVAEQFGVRPQDVSFLETPAGKVLVFVYIESN